MASRWISWVPASPAPKTMIFTAAGAGDTDRSRMANAAYLAPSIAATASSAPPRICSGQAGRPPIRTGPVASRQPAVSATAWPTAMTSSRLPRR